MRSAIRRTAALFGASALLLGLAVRVSAQDPVTVAPDNYQVLGETENVRLLELRLPPGMPTPLHSHPTHVTWCMTNATLRITMPDGVEMPWVMQPNELRWSGPVRRSLENLGDTEAMAYILEFKAPEPITPMSIDADTPLLLQGLLARAAEKPKEKSQHVMLSPADVKWIDDAPGLPAGAQLAVLSGDPKKAGPFTMRIRSKAGVKVPPHWHPDDENVTVLSGAIHMGMGEMFDKTKAKKYAAGSYLMMPAGTRHFAWLDEDTIIQVHGNGPWGITYVNAADDPRKK